MLRDLEMQVMELYARADQAVAQYQLLSGLSCPIGCVQCCHSPKVEATVLEMIPLACHLFRSNQAELLLKRLEKEEMPPSCMLFRPDLVGTLGGGCSQYAHRALVCRLFGFAGNVDRSGVPRLALCRVMKQAMTTGQPEDYLQELPIFHDYGLAVTAMNPSLGERRLPINEALQQALLKVGLLYELEHDHRNTPASGSPQDEPFDRPLLPRRRAA